MKRQVSIDKYRNYWEKNTTGSQHILKYTNIKLGTKEYFEYFDEVKRSYDNWALESNFYEFNNHSGERILEVGCGNGWALYRYAKGSANVAGLEISQAALELTKKRFEFTNLKAKLVVGKGEDLPLRSNCFDLVACIGVLHNIPNPKDAIEEIHRILKPHGKLILMVFNKDSWFYRIVLPIAMLVRKKSRKQLLNEYDGIDNPLTNVFSKREMFSLFKNFCNFDIKIQHLPDEHFFLIAKILPRRIKELLAKYIGFYLYIKCEKTKLK